VVIVAEVCNLKGIVLAGLRQAQKLIVTVDRGTGIDLQLRIMTPDGDFLISMTLAEDMRERERQLQQVSKFMAWKKAWVFTMAGALRNPDAVYCFGATHQHQIAVVSAIMRSHTGFGIPQWLTPEQIGEEIPALLPPGEAALDAADLALFDAYFGPLGKFPALHLQNGGRWHRATPAAA
jgi:hypothetical protein